MVRMKVFWFLSSWVIIMFTYHILVTRFGFVRESYPVVDCSTLGYRNFRYNISAPPTIKDYRYFHIQDDRSSKYHVPNIVHYIWYTNKPTELKFHQMLSVLSVHKNIKPEVIFLHTNLAPIGKYWERVKQIPELVIVRREPTICLFGKPVKNPAYETSKSNIDRLVVLAESGGIYFDFDVLAIQPFEDLRQHESVMGMESATKFCGATIISSKSSLFLKMWLNTYLDDYRANTWAYNSGQVPFNIWKRYPNTVHVEPTKLMRPNGFEYKKIWWNQEYKWWENYSMHLWYRTWKMKRILHLGQEPNFNNIRTWNSTFGAITRTVLYGKPDLITN